MKAPSIRAVRCAIYTRVSTEYGLDQEFNSLDAQYDAAGRLSTLCLRTQRMSKPLRTITHQILYSPKLPRR